MGPAPGLGAGTTGWGSGGLARREAEGEGDREAANNAVDDANSASLIAVRDLGGALRDEFGRVAG